jgi:hypothetical protein
MKPLFYRIWRIASATCSAAARCARRMTRLPTFVSEAGDEMDPIAQAPDHGLARRRCAG